MKTFVNVGAARGFANRVEAALAQLRFQNVNRFEMGAAFPQPVGQSMTLLDLDQGIQEPNLPNEPNTSPAIRRLTRA